MQDDYLDVSTCHTTLFRQNLLIPLPRGASFKTKTLRSVELALELWWRCNYIDYGRSNTAIIEVQCCKSRRRPMPTLMVDLASA